MRQIQPNKLIICMIDFQKRGVHLKEQREHKVWELERSQSLLQRFVYIQIFGETREALENARSEVLHGVNKYIHIHPISVAQRKVYFISYTI